MFTIEGKNLMLDAFAGAVTHVGLLDETDTEISGGDYARQPVTWNAADNGQLTASGTLAFDIPDGVTVAKAIFMDALTGGIKYAEEDVTGSITYDIDSIQLDIT